MLNQAVSMALPSNDGALVTVPIPNAHATVVDFFAPTCVPCKAALPLLVAKEEAIEAKGGKLVLVAVLGDGESSDDAKAALTSWGVSRSFLVDNGDASRASAGVSSLPATLVLDAQGTMKWAAPVGASADDVVAAIP